MASRIFGFVYQADGGQFLPQSYNFGTAVAHITEAPDVLAAQAELEQAAGSIAVTEAVDVAAIEGNATTPAVIAATEAVDVLAAQTTMGVGGTAGWTEARDTLAIGAGATRPASIAATEAADNYDMVAGGEYARFCVFGYQEHASGMVFDQQVIVTGLSAGRIGSTEARDVLAMPVCSLWGDGLSVEGVDVINVFSGPIGSMDIREWPDVADIDGYASTVLNAVTNWQEAPDTDAITADNLFGTTQGYFVLNEAGDVLALSAKATVPASMDLREEADASEIATTSTSSGALAITEAPDVLYLEGPRDDPWTRKAEQVTTWTQRAKGPPPWTKRNRNSTVWTDR